MRIFLKIFSQARRSRREREANAAGVQWVGEGRWYLHGPNNPNKEQTARVLEKGWLAQGGAGRRGKKNKKGRKSWDEREQARTSEITVKGREKEKEREIEREREAEEERWYERREEMARVTEKWRGNWG